MKEKLKNLIVHASFILYLYAVFKIILFKFRSIDVAILWEELLRSLRNPDYVIWRVHEGNLVPFKEISRTIHILSRHELLNLVGNIAIFLPFGFFLGLLSRNGISLLGALICSLGLSFSLESAQAVFAIGSFDVDDLILNSIGGLLGCMGYRLCAAYPFRGRLIADRNNKDSFA